MTDNPHECIHEDRFQGIEKDINGLWEKVEDISKTGTEESRAGSIAIKRLDFVVLEMQKASTARHSENKARFAEGDKRMNEIEKNIYLNEKEMHKVFRSELDRYGDELRTTQRWYFTAGTAFLGVLVAVLKWVWP